MVRHQRRCGSGLSFIALLGCSLAAGLGCGEDSEAGASDAANAGAAVDSGAAGDVPVEPDAGDGAAGEAAAPVSSFIDYWSRRRALQARRYDECFKLPAWISDGVGADPAGAAQLESINQGRLGFVATRAQACLTALAGLSCGDLLARFGESDSDLPACAGVVEPQVDEGASCSLDQDCRGGDQLACAERAPADAEADAGGAASCARRCTARLALGADCAGGGSCAAGAYCRVVRRLGAAPAFRCVPLPQSGEACDPRCGPGLFCARASDDGWENTDQGVCRPRMPGSACKNDWQCPWPLFCARTTAGAVCAPPPGRLGRACVPGDDHCPLGSSCRAAVEGGFFCQPWPGPGGACGYLAESPTGAPEYTGCAAGFCDFARGRGRGLCLALGGEGAACQDPKACQSGLLCAAGRDGHTTCQTVVATAGAAGAACDFWNRCGDGLRCLAGICAAPASGTAACPDPGAALGVIGGSPLLAPKEVYRLALVHGPASRQPTALGRRIATLEPWKGRLYVGYGDYGANTGPIVISAWDPVANTVAEEMTFASEAVALYRPINDWLYTPAIDPRGPGLTVYARGAPWTSVEPFVVAHAFDLATLNGQDLWVVGAQGADAVAWRSLDGGAHWSEASRETSGPGLFGRYYFAGVLDDKLYLQVSPAETGQSRVFDGTSWSVGPNLLPQGGQGWNPRRFHDQLIYATWQPIGAQGSTLLAFDGAQVRPIFPHEVLDFAVSPDSVTVLGTDQRIRRSRDLVHWWVLGLAPEGARSLALLDGRLYLGGTDARLFMLESAP